MMTQQQGRGRREVDDRRQSRLLDLKVHIGCCEAHTDTGLRFELTLINKFFFYLTCDSGAF